MISKPLGIRVAHVEADGDFDTHDNQKSLAGSLADVSECLAAFQADLEARGVSGRTLTLVWSEFGRRPEQNGSGTDHGAGGVAWVQGDRARPGIHSEYPSLSQLDRTTTSRSRSTSGASTRACWSSIWAPTPPR